MNIGIIHRHKLTLVEPVMQVPVKFAYAGGCGFFTTKVLS